MYTGQRAEAGIGLYYYNARWYDPSLGRFAQADTIIQDPNITMSYDRFSYVRNNSLRYNDPTGREVCGTASGQWLSVCMASIGYYDRADMTSYVQYIADSYNIHVSPNDHLEYNPNLSRKYIEDGKEKYRYEGGYTPRLPGYYDTDEDIYTQSGNPMIADDTAVYIGPAIMYECYGQSIDCIASIIGHEAVHSWVEYKLDPDNSNFDEDPIRKADMEHMLDAMSYVEEQLAIKTMMESNVFGEEGINYQK
jgi:RHS repeat-associated protein